MIFEPKIPAFKKKKRRRAELFKSIHGNTTSAKLPTFLFFIIFLVNNIACEEEHKYILPVLSSNPLENQSVPLGLSCPVHLPACVPSRRISQAKS